MTTSQQWEYCLLAVGIASRTTSKPPELAMDLGIYYFGDQYVNQLGNCYHILSESSGNNRRLWSYDPWQQAIALLGVGGWELVSVHHGGDSYPDNWPNSHTIAYLKRPIIPGRRIDEPKLILP